MDTRYFPELSTEATPLQHPDFDVIDPATFVNVPWSQVGLVINASTYTAVDAAETTEGPRDAWNVNVTGLGRLVEITRTYRIALVQAASDYVFDGIIESHTEDEPTHPLGVYGQDKAAGDALVATLPRHWIVHTSWVVGDGNTFVRTTASLADRGAKPNVVDD